MNGTTISIIPSCSYYDDNWSGGDWKISESSSFKLELSIHFTGIVWLQNPIVTINL